MDVVALADVLTKFLTPFLPYLINVGNKVFDGVVAKVGEDAWDKAKTLWAKLQPKIEAKPIAKGAAQELANFPNDLDAKDTLQKQLKKMLDEDTTLAAELDRLMQEDSEEISKVVNTFSQMVSGDENVVQNVTGDSNKFIGKVEGDATIN